MNRLLRIIKSISYWSHPGLRFNPRVRIAKSSQWDIDQSARINCEINVGEGADLYIGPNVIIDKGSRLIVDSGAKCFIDSNVIIGKNSSLTVSDSHSVKIGKNTTFFSDLLISGFVEIGEDCLFGPRVTLLSGTHIISGKQKIREMDKEFFESSGKNYVRKIEISSDCWFGVNSVVSPGVCIEKGCVVGANSVVTKNLDEYSVVGGVPAKLIKKRLDRGTL